MALRFEELINVTVSSLSKREEKYLSTAGAVFVISDEDIRRAGVRSIPDALRLAPGLQVSRTNMNQFQIGIRGQTDFWTDSLLVMVDGRPVYNTTFSGVWWVAQNYPLEEIDRIEIIRGPGGAIWGSNAVNGVINIITKNAEQTQGARITAGGGTEEKGFASIRYGNRIGRFNYRVYGMGENRHGGLANHGNALFAFGAEANDYRRFNQQGFRFDFDAVATKISLHGDSYKMRSGQVAYWIPSIQLGQRHIQYAGANLFNGKNMVFRLEKVLFPGMLFKGQLFYDQYKVHTQIIREKKETFDGDFQVDFTDVLNQDISLGMNIRRLRSRFNNTPQFQMPTRTTKLSSFFFNDQLTLFDGLLRITGGVKVERNSYTSWEHQPSARAIVSDDSWALWVAASESVRTPNDMENGLQWNRKTTGGPPYIVRQIGDGRVTTEKVRSYEVGARLRPSELSLIEVTAFKLFYKGIPDTWQARAQWFNDGLIPVYPEYLTNVLNGKGDGVEVNFRYQPKEWVTLKGSYTYLHQIFDDFPIKDGETIWTVRSNKGQDPANRFHVGLSLDPFQDIEFDANLYFTGPFREGDIFGHHRLDVRFGWEPIDGLEISAVGQDLLRYSHRENTDNSLEYSTMIQQGYYILMTYHYK